jgi:hypothetical protein
MKKSKPTGSTTTKPPADVGCKIDIHIDNQGDVNIQLYCARPEQRTLSAASDDRLPTGCTGACVPASWLKPKQSRRSKLDKLAQYPRAERAGRVVLPSDASLSRRQSGVQRAGTASLRDIPWGCPPDLRRVPACARASFDSLSGAARCSLPTLRNVDQPLGLRS